MGEEGLVAYFQRFGFCPRQIDSAPEGDLRLVVVVPCFDEPDLTGCLTSLRACTRPDCAVEVIVVINSSTASPEIIREGNARTLRDAQAWQAQHDEPRWRVHLLYFPDLPAKHAGVGLARKIGMDEALRRFEDSRNLERGVVVNFDADCHCDPDYLVSVERHFERHPRTPGCSIYFEHPLGGALPREVYDAVTEYELHLRYYVQALRWARHPHAYHTVGSSMAVRAQVYRAQGGMNKRTAGEDFYFLHKVIALGGYTDLLDTVVRPSPRPSHRVPFGTGRTVTNVLEGKPLAGYPLAAFENIRLLWPIIPSLYQGDPGACATLLETLPSPLGSFLAENDFLNALTEMKRQTASAAAFEKRFVRWFDGFRTLKFVHHARDGFHGPAKIGIEAARLAALIDPSFSGNSDLRSLLEIYRTWDRRGVEEETKFTVPKGTAEK